MVATKQYDFEPYSTNVYDAMLAEIERFCSATGKPKSEAGIIISQFTMGPAIGTMMAIMGKG